MSSTTLWRVATAAALLCAGPCAAQNAFTLYGGYLGGGSLQRVNASTATSVNLEGGGSVALAADWAVDASRQIQLFASWASSEIPASAATAGSPAQPAVPLTLTYLHIGGTNYFDGPGARIGSGSYVVGGLGVTVMTPGLSGLSNELLPSMNLGIGYQWPLAPRLSLKLELRGLFTLVNSSTRLFCSGGCVVQIQGDSFAQAQALAGLSYSF